MKKNIIWFLFSLSCCLMANDDERKESSEIRGPSVQQKVLEIERLGQVRWVKLFQEIEEANQFFQSIETIEPIDISSAELKNNKEYLFNLFVTKNRIEEYGKIFSNLLERKKISYGEKTFNKNSAKKILSSFFTSTINGKKNFLTDQELDQRIIYLLGAFYQDMIEMKAYSLEKSVVHLRKNYSAFLEANTLLKEYDKKREEFFSIMNNINMKDMKEKITENVQKNDTSIANVSASRKNLFQDAKTTLNSFKKMLLSAKKLFLAIKLFHSLNTTVSADLSTLDTQSLKNSQDRIKKALDRIKTTAELTEKISKKLEEIWALSR
ncbi:hypothetical protein [Holospora curviuscula]|uniref:Uncharacterized protein n=1 Tax=Holospora curviuscula TaxID=1082868 RepID=A0A2S5RDV9_9PROT|nr:hypothetical protein [Holospora curviuscula]PPE05315.1 hypothetical protein HCUR_00272 [Holospora curviuscula]